MKGKYKKLVSIIGAIILGAIGSGLWESVFKPSLSFSSNFVYNIVTLGLHSLRNQVYVDVAKGYYERQSFDISADTSFIIGLSLITLWSLFKITEIILYYINPDSVKLEEPSILTKFMRRLPSKMFPTINLSNAFIFGIVFCMVISGFSLFRNSYINNRIAYYRQLHEVVAPVINEKERLIFNSEFGQIETKEDYDAIIKSLQQIAQKNKLKYREQ